MNEHIQELKRNFDSAMDEYVNSSRSMYELLPFLDRMRGNTFSHGTSYFYVGDDGKEYTIHLHLDMSVFDPNNRIGDRLKKC